MKREFLEKLGLEKEAVDSIMNENGKDIEAVKSQLTEAQETIKAANTEIAKFKSMDVESVQRAADEWKTKYEQAQKDADEKIAALEYDNAVSAFAGGLVFSSDYARKGFVADLKAQGFKLKNGELLGAGDYVKQVKQNSPETFKPEPSGGAGFSDKQPPGQDKNAASYMDKFMRGQLE